jgi:hypothetical protein
MTRARRLRAAAVRVLAVLLAAVLALLLFVTLAPGALRRMVLPWIPGAAEIPAFASIPPAPQISAPRGELPEGYAALSGRLEPGGIGLGCGFLLALEDGRRAGVLTAHAAPPKLPGLRARFYAPNGAAVGDLTRWEVRGQTFLRQRFSLDYSLWSVDPALPAEKFLEPDPRGGGQPGEAVTLYSPGDNGAGGSQRWAGRVMRVDGDEAIWIQLDEAFDPRGSSGCPVLSQHTGKVLGMVVAGTHTAPVVLGLHPIASLVEKIEASIP